MTFAAPDGGSHVGIRLERGAVADLSSLALAEGLPRLRDVRDVLALGSDWRDTVERLAARAGEMQAGGGILQLDELRVLAPLGTRSLILCSGGNFRQHRQEMADRSGARLSSAHLPRGFIKSCASVIGDGEAVRLPRSCPDMVDYEGEIAAVVGTACYEAEKGTGYDYVAGYTLLNDVSARDWVPAVRGAATGREAIDAWEHNIMCKQFPTFCPIGPELVTSDEVGRPDELGFRTVVNGEIRQETSLADLEFDVGELVVYYSQHYALRPGDIVTTGTPGGVAVGMDSPRFLRSGDLVSVESPSLGKLSNAVT